MARTDAAAARTNPSEDPRLGAERVAIEVRDRGIGIAAEDLPRVFDPYFTTRRTGTGLGLAISRHIIEGLGGTIASRAGRAKALTSGSSCRYRQELEGRG